MSKKGKDELQQLIDVVFPFIEKLLCEHSYFCDD